MSLVHDTAERLRFAAELVNSKHAWGEESAHRASLMGLVEAHEHGTCHGGDEEHLAALQLLRKHLRRIWSMAGDENHAVAEVNALLRSCTAVPRLTRHDNEAEWHLHLVSKDESFGRILGAEMAIALADLICSGELRRLKHCSAATCDGVLIDLSRNNSRKFCSTGNCGNRQHVLAYRARQSSPGQ